MGTPRCQLGFLCFILFVFFSSASFSLPRNVPRIAIAGGKFFQAHGLEVGNLARWQRSSGQDLDGWDRNVYCGPIDFDDDVDISATGDGGLFYGGDFDNVCGIDFAMGVAFFDGKEWIAVNNPIRDINDGVPQAVLCTDENNCYVAGHELELLFNSDISVNSFIHYERDTDSGEWSFGNGEAWADLTTDPDTTSRTIEDLSDSDGCDVASFLPNTLQRVIEADGNVFWFVMAETEFCGDERRREERGVDLGTRALLRAGENTNDGLGGWEVFLFPDTAGLDAMYDFDITPANTLIVSGTGAGESEDGLFDAIFVDSDHVFDTVAPEEDDWEQLFKNRLERERLDLLQVAVVDEDSRYFYGLVDDDTESGDSDSDDGDGSGFYLLFSEGDDTPTTVGTQMFFNGDEDQSESSVQLFLVDGIPHVVGRFSSINYVTGQDNRYLDNARGLAWYSADDERWVSLGGGHNAIGDEGQRIAYSVDDDAIWIADADLTRAYDVNTNSLIIEVELEDIGRQFQPNPWLSLGRRKLYHHFDQISDLDSADFQSFYMKAALVDAEELDDVTISATFYAAGRFEAIGPFMGFGSFVLITLESEDLNNQGELSLRDSNYEFTNVGGGLFNLLEDDITEFTDIDRDYFAGLVNDFVAYDVDDDGDEDLLFAVGNFESNAVRDPLCNVAYLDIEDGTFEGVSGAYWQDVDSGCSTSLYRDDNTLSSIQEDILTYVSAVVVWDGYLYVAGNFRYCGGAEVNGLGRIKISDGVGESHWEALVPAGLFSSAFGGSQGSVEENIQRDFVTIEQINDNLWIGGSFTYIGNMLVNGLVTWQPRKGFRVPLTRCNEGLDANQRCVNELSFTQATTNIQPSFCSDFAELGGASRDVVARCKHPNVADDDDDGEFAILRFEMSDADNDLIEGVWKALGTEDVQNHGGRGRTHGKQLIARNASRIVTVSEQGGIEFNELLVYDLETHAWSPDSLHVEIDNQGNENNERVIFFVAMNSPASSPSSFLLSFLSIFF